jgi:NAD(P)-dependent dehydrogenase (short-subunit alcohol dehydrogenase family)
LLRQADWSRVIGVNLHGAFYAMGAQSREMRRQGGGAIVNVASMWQPDNLWWLVAHTAHRSRLAAGLSFSHSLPQKLN